MALYTCMEAAMKVLSQKGGSEGQKVVAIVQEMMEGRRVPRCVETTNVHPVIILEGLDGTGKTTVIEGLQRELGDVNCLSSPPECLRSFRQHFDGQVSHIRRAFYLLGNYACALSLRKHSEKPVVIDRFWPSSIAYALALDHQVVPNDMPEELKGALQMPLDLQDLMPGPVVWLLLHLPEAQRVRRVRHRAADGSGMTPEEVKLEDQKLPTNLMDIYRVLKIGDDRLVEIDASGSTEEVLRRVQEVVISKCEQWRQLTPVSVPISVNWHFTRQCNYHCEFCFHTAKTSFCLPSTKDGLEESKRCLARLRDAGMQKINFSGGEPFLHAKALGTLVRFCKEELRLESVSIVSNGSHITAKWMEEFGYFLDILAISCDSFHEATNVLIGRGRGEHVKQLESIRQWCDDFEVLFKINSVITKHNVNEDMSAHIERLKPIRWKVFQCLPIKGENVGDVERNVEPLLIPPEAFQGFIDRHRRCSSVKQVLVAENNVTMKDSYLILDEYLRFLNCTSGAKVPGPSIRDVAVVSALRTAGFDENMFQQRLGEYEWSKDKVLQKERRTKQAKRTGLMVLSLALCGAALALVAKHRRCFS
ncbi:Radical S-adenosyl methionine domain-containing protein 2 (Inflammatory response gene 6 protein) (Viperin) (Virus inhibitory protein [Durusdinium trenchii]